MKAERAAFRRRLLAKSAAIMLPPLFAVLGGCAGLETRATAATVVATVHDGQGRPVAGATVSLRDGEGNRSVRQTESDTKGRVTFDKLPFGRYRLVVAHEDYLEEQAEIQLLDNGQLLHVRVKSVVAFEEEIAGLIEDRRYDEARHLLEEVDKQTDVLDFLQAILLFRSQRYTESMQVVDALRIRFPRLAVLDQLHTRAADHVGHSVPGEADGTAPVSRASR